GVPAPAARDDFDPHHRSLRAAVDWSFELLSLSDRPLVAAASVFRGSFSLDAFRTVCSPDLERAQAAAAVSRLVDASLLAPERPPDGSLRYRMLEPVREFALERLEREEMVGEVRDRHACWYLER